jgi:hypothetical protein
MTPQLARGPGRPALPPEVKLHSISLRLTAEEIYKLKYLGGRDWVREQLEKVPTRARKPVSPARAVVQARARRDYS